MKHTLFFSFLVSLFVNSYLQSQEEQKTNHSTPSECPYIYASVNVITGEYCEAQTDLVLEGPHPLTLKRFYNSLGDISGASGIGWHFNHPNLPIALNEDAYLPVFPNKKIVYEYDDERRLHQVKTLDLRGNVEFNYLNISYGDEGSQVCYVEAPDGRRVAYKFAKTEPSRTESGYLLEEVTLSDGQVCSYKYEDHPFENKHLVVRRDEPNGRYLINEYYQASDKDSGLIIGEDPLRSYYAGKIKSQSAPMGCDLTPITTHQYKYEPGSTEVLDALNNKMIYRHQDNHLTAVETFIKEETGEDELYRVERFFWKNGLMTARTLEDALGAVWVCHNFNYDDCGALISETLYGNISGKSDFPILVDEEGKSIGKDVESYTKRFQYSQDADHLLISQIEDNGITTCYRYDPKSKLLCGKFIIADKTIQVRHFYAYDDNGILIRTIVDDGKSEDPEDINRVTERHITNLQTSKEPVLYGMPEVVEERYLDLVTKEEKVLKQTINHYSHFGKLLQKDIYDACGRLNESQSYNYDRLGRLISTLDDKGTYCSWDFDANGNKISLATGSSSGECKQTVQVFDFANRQIRAEHCSETGKLEVQSFRYDAVGNKIGIIDTYGNETEYTYDSLGRVTESIQPIVLDAFGCTIRPIKKFSYDIFDRVIVAFDPNDNETRTRYNVHGKPIEIIYADGSKENFEYDRAGLLKQSTAKNGTKVLYHRDALGRVVKTEIFSKDDTLLSSTSSTFNAFHLTSATDARGTTVHYTYDGAGRQIEKKTRLEDAHAVTEWNYDSLGQIKTKKEWFGDGPVDYVETHHERDEINRLKSISTVNAQGELLRQSSLEIDESQPSYHITENDKFYNDLGQNVPQVIETLANGTNVISTYDALGRIESIVRKNSLGQTLSHQEMRYDAAGNKVRETHKCITSEGVLGNFTIAWWYGPGNRLEGITEGLGTTNQRHTVYLFNDAGQLENIVKPDGTMLVHRYNASGCLSELFSTDNTIHYTYGYDANFNIISVKDMISGMLTERAYNSANQMVYEKIGNGLQIINEYDHSGKRTQITLPDHSMIRYVYDGANLREVLRLNKDGQQSYSHSYTEFDLEGNLLASKMIARLGDINFAYDDRKIKSIISPFWSENIPDDGYDTQGNLLKASFTDNNGKYDLNFSYNERSQLENESSIFKRSYAFDSLENLVQCDQNLIECNFLNQMVATKNSNYTYDSNGNLLAKTSNNKTTEYGYDALNRLVTVTDTGNTTRYTYDAFHRRLTKDSYRWDNTTSSWKLEDHTCFLYDGQNEIGATDQTGKLIELRVLGLGIGAEIGAAVAIELEGHVYAPIHDHRGSVCCLIDSESGTAIENYRYSAFGEKQIQDENGFVKSESIVNNPWSFSGKRFDQESGFFYFGKRYYSPNMGRWTTLDPLGFADGPNRYAYAQNNPMTRVDLYGLWSLNTVWKRFLSAGATILDSASKVMDAVQRNLSYHEYIRDDIEDMGHKIVGAAFLRMVGYYSQPPETGIYGNGELNDKIRITLVNGILNIRHDFMDSLKMVSETHGGVNVHYIFRPTEGWAWDLFKCTLVKCGVVSVQAKQLADTWKKLIQDMGGTEGGGMIIHYAHSIGGTDTYIAKHLLTPEEQKMIRVITFGSATMIPNTGFQSVINYVSRRDGVSLFDPFTRLMGLFEDDSNIIYVGTHLGVPLVDHLFDAHTYRTIMEGLGNEFTRLYAQAA